MAKAGQALDARALVQLLDDAGEAVGAGFLVGPDLVATCAHVVATATGDDARDGGAPTRAVTVRFPWWTDAELATAQVLRWAPIRPDGGGDVALLRLDRRAPRGTGLPPVRRADRLWGHRFRVFGFPAGSPDGVWSTGTLRGEQGTRWFQLQGDPGDQNIEEGFSGSPVWDENSGAVVGMTVAADRDTATTTAYMIPVAEVLGLDPELLPCPYRGLEPFGEEHAEFYFGRDREIDLLVDRVAARDVVVVAGASGSGKSSLLGAGLVPRLRADGITVLGVRARAGQDAASLAAAVLAELPDAAGDDVAATSREDAGAQLRRAVTAITGRPIVVVDQFEELAAAEPDTAREALELLVELVGGHAARRSSTTGGRAGLVLTVRPDSLEALLTSDLAPVFGAGTVYVPPMRRTELRDAVVGPAERAPGLTFEDGLVERILDDADAGPGQLPLVESLLTQLWERREGGSLTLAAYAEIGGVPGAVTRQAEVALADLSPAERPPLRRLLTVLARPDRDRRFVRRPVPTATLGASEAALVDRLASARLVVLTPGPTGEETVELAHQSLIDHWPRLRGWLAEDRDFLQWNAQLDEQRERWEGVGRDPGALLRGSPLSVAQEWVSDRPDDVPEPAREYVGLGTARQRRDVRRWRIVTAVLAVLVLIAGTLAIAATDRGNRLDRQLATANANTLGTEAAARAGRDPLLATQLALAAWRADPDSPAARTALGRQALALQAVDGVFAGVADPSKPGGMQVGRDGSAVLVDDPAGVAVLGGVDGRALDRWVVPGVTRGIQLALSPDGRRLAGANPTTGEVLTWDVAARAEPVRLRPPDREVPDAPRRPLMFSPDGGRLLTVDAGSAAFGELTVWDLATGARIPHRLGPLPMSTLGGVWQSGDPDRIVLRYGAPGDLDTRLVTRSLSATAPDVDLPAGASVAGSGDLAVTCVPARGDGLGGVEVTRTDTGVPLRRIPLNGPPCGASGAVRITVDREHVVVEATGSNGKDYRRLEVADLREGRVESVIAPFDPRPSDVSEPAVSVAADVGAFRDRAGRTTVLMTAPNGDLIRLRGAVPTVREGARNLLVELTDDGRHAVTRRVGSDANDQRDAPDRAATLAALAGRGLLPTGYSVLDPVSAAVRGSLAESDIERGDGVVGSGTADTLSLLSRVAGRYVINLYGIPALARAGRIELPAVPGPDAVAVAAAITDDQRSLTLHGGLLTLWDPRTSRPVAAPIDVADSPAERDWFRTRAPLFARPGHPTQALVGTPDGWLELWDVVERRLVGAVEARAVSTSARVAISSDGRQVAMMTRGDLLEIRDLDTGALRRPPIPAPRVLEVMGFTGDGQLATVRADPLSPIDLWDLDRGVVGATLRTAHPVPVGAKVVIDGRWDLTAPGTIPVRVDLTARSWFDRLCGIVDRDFTEAERALLPPGTNTDRPCGA